MTPQEQEYEPLHTEDDFVTAVAELAALERHDYDRRRSAEAKRLGVRLQTLDEAIDAERKELGPCNTVASGTAFQMEAPEPWPAAVIGKELLDEIVLELQTYLAMQKGTAEAVALWVVFTYVFDLFPISPYLSIQSPAPSCGKTTLLSAIGRLVCKPLKASNISPPALFRTIEKVRPCLLLDEAETFLKHNEEVRGILNSGHSKAAAFVIRTVGEDFEPVQFSTWCCKAFASIGGLPATIEGRSIIVNMRRRLPNEPIQRFREDRQGRFTELARKCVRWANDNADALVGADPVIPDALEDRPADNWRGLLCIADLAGRDWPEKARRAAVLLSGPSSTDTEIQERLMSDIRDVFANRNAETMTPKDLAEALVMMEDTPWAEWRNGRPLTSGGLGKLLAPFCVKSRQMRVRGKPGRYYHIEDFNDSFHRYTPETNDTNDTALNSKEIRDSQTSQILKS